MLWAVVQYLEEEEMKKLVTMGLVVLSLLTVGLMVGCNSGPSSNQGGDLAPASIELRSTHTEIRGLRGENRSEYITAIAKDINGAALPGVKIDFGIRNPLSYKGTIAKLAADTVSDENGEVHATYSVVIQQSTPVVITATAGQITKELTITVIELASNIGGISIEITNDVLSVPPNQSRTTAFTARVVDNVGNALSGMQVRFSTSPAGLGIVDSDTGTTDIQGKVIRNFTSIVNQYGFCRIIGQVGDSVGSAMVEMRRVDAPAYLSLIAEPDVVEVVSGQNASITLTATVTDSNRVGVPGTTVEFRVMPIIEGGPTYGAITARDTTDDAGVVTTTFTSLGQFGKQKIVCMVVPSNQEADPDGGVRGEAMIEVKRLTAQIDDLTVRATPSILDLPADSTGKATIQAQVRDVNKVGLPNVQVKFKTDLGSLSFITATDSAGIATAQFRNNFEQGLATITASIPGTPFEATCSIICRQNQDETGFLSLTADKDFIYADNGLTYATLRATLKDQDNQAMVGKDVTFHSSFGAINSPITTDTLGVATAIFVDQGVPSVDENGNVIPVRIFAKYRAFDLVDSVEVTIRPRNPVASITLNSQQLTLQAGSGDSAAVRATCFLLNEAYAPAGTIVSFEVDGANGFFTSEAVPVGTFGVAENFYVAGLFVGTAVLRAKVQNEGGGEDSVVYSNEVQITLLSGPPSRIRLTASPNVLNTNDPGMFSSITATVTDTAGNPVRQGELVRFTTDKGDITPSALTDTLGRGVGRLTAGVQSGTATITGTVTVAGGEISATVTVTFVAGLPNTIELTADPLQIAVAGTGGVATSTLKAIVRDANGNPVERTTRVVFQLLNNPDPPLGCNLNNRGSIDSANTANGQAVASLNSGDQIGGKLIRAYTWRDPDSSNAGVDNRPRTDTVSVVLAAVAVVAGPPFQLDMDVNDDGEDAGGGTWQIPVSARVWDVHRNPVADRIPVVFTVDPQIATIDPGFTGNDIGDGVTNGIAYSWLRYHSTNTFDPITISAEVQAPDGLIIGEKAHILPLQDGILALQVDPQNWMFDRARPNDTCLVRVWAILTDGHQILIDDAPILFRTDRARFYWKNLRLNGRYIPFFPEVARRFTGLQNQENNEPRGTATVYLRGIMDDFYLDAFTLEVTVHVEAAVEGYEVSADPAFIFCTRH